MEAAEKIRPGSSQIAKLEAERVVAILAHEFSAGLPAEAFGDLSA